MKIAKIFQMLTYWPTYGFFRILTRYKIEGQENLIGLENKGVIFASNHASFLDGPISAASMPRHSFYPSRFFPIRFLVLKKYFKWINPFLPPLCFLIAAYVRINGSIPIEKTGGDLFKALKDAISALKNGDKIWIYPEGGMTKDGNLRQGKRGVAFLRKQTGAPVVPVGIVGSFKTFWFPEIFSTLLHRNKVIVRIGKPIYSFGDITLEEETKIIMSKIAELMKS